MLTAPKIIETVTPILKEHGVKEAILFVRMLKDAPWS